MISRSDAPPSANSGAEAFRSPGDEHCSRPAASHCFPNQRGTQPTRASGFPEGIDGWQKADRNIIGRLLAAPQYKELIDFDTGKTDVRRLGATARSTLIVYKDGKEVGRSVGETQAERIADLFDKAV